MLTGGAGGRAVSRAFNELFGVDGLHGLSLGGRTDSWIFAELARRHSITADAVTLERIRQAYLSHLRAEILEPGPSKRVLPGVESLLTSLVQRDDAVVALMTGNIEQGARIKLEHFDLWRYFNSGGFGDVAPDRHGLLRDAVAAVAAQSGREFQFEEIVIVGDTPLDVEVAVQSGARSLAVATGSFGPDALSEAGADVVLADLADTGRVMSALGLE